MTEPAVASLRRADAVAQLPDRADVLVVGGGITGAGVALDAAARGASVVLVDRADLAAGTSSRSSRLVHGGARSLATGDLALVAEGVRERDRLRRMAPHLVLPLPFVIPADTRGDLVALRVGMTVYDALAAGRGVANHRALSTAEVLRHAPGLAGGFRAGGVRYWDCRTDDARLTVEVARAAAARGAVIAPHVAVTSLHRHRGRVVGATLEDAIDGGTVDLEARWVVSASGVWAADVERLDGAEARLDVVAARGVHLVFDRADLPVNAALVVPSSAGDGRHLFVVPWGRQVYVGTTDAPHEGSLEAPEVRASDAEYVLAGVNAAFGTTLRLGDAVGAWAGLRPLLHDRQGERTADLSRRHAVVTAPGSLTVTGGKLTTFRRMAADVVDRIAAEEGWPRRSPTTSLTVGGDRRATMDRLRAAAAGTDLDDDLLAGLHHRHGDRAPALVEAGRRHDELGPLVPGLPYLRAEVRWAVRHELAARLSDVLDRRLRVATRHREAGGLEAIRWSADVLADELGWSRERRRGEVADYLTGVRAGRGVVPLPVGA